MLALILSPLYILLNFYLAKWLVVWMSACHKHFQKKWIRAIIIIAYTFFSSAILIGFILPPGNAQRLLKGIGNYWLGVLIYIIIVVVVADMMRIILYKSGKIPKEKLSSKKLFIFNGTICIAIISTISVLGVINARIIHTTKYNITINKKVSGIKKLEIVMVADLHIGYNIGCNQIQQMVEKINKVNPDLVLLAGDIFDNEYEAIDNPNKLINILRNIKSKYGTYAVYGNHDISEKTLVGFTFDNKNTNKMSDIRMDRLLSKANIKLLRDEKILIDNKIYLYGRPDRERLGRGIIRRKKPNEITKDMDLKKPVIVLDHQPKELQELAQAGVDLDLSGHTHNGQLTPGNLVIKYLWYNSYGYKKINTMHSIVTSGVGLYGPNMRVGTTAEITSIKVNFE